MIKDNSKREQFLLMLFPAALVLAIYSVVFAVPLRQEKSAIEAEYLREQAAAVSPDDAELAAISLGKEKDNLKKLQNRVSLSKQQIRELSTDWRSRGSKLKLLKEITTLMRDYNLSIVSQGGDEPVAVSTYLTELFETMNLQSGQDPIEFWPVKVRGAYFDMLDFLTDVNLLARSIIPVSITMEPGEDNAPQTWTIVFAN